MSSYRSNYAQWNKNESSKSNTSSSKPKATSEVPVAKKYDSTYSRSKPDAATSKEASRPPAGLDKTTPSRYTSLGSSSFRSTYSPSPSTYSRDKSGTRERDLSSSTSTTNRYPASYTAEEKPEKQSVLNKYLNAKSSDKSETLSAYNRLSTNHAARSRDHSPVDKGYNYTRNISNTQSRNYDEDVTSKNKTSLSSKDKTRDVGANEREKDIPSKSSKTPAYSASSYPSFKLYQRPSTYSRPIVKDEPKVEATSTSRYTTPSRFSSTYTRSSLIDKPSAPYVPHTPPVISNTNTGCGSEQTTVKSTTSGNDTINNNHNNLEATVNVEPSKKDEASDQDDEEESSSEDESSDSEPMSMISVTVVTRGTSPTAPSSSIYIRTRRADMAKTIEKTISRPKKRSEMVDKEMQSDRLDDTTRSSRYGSTARISASPWSSYMDSRYSSPISSGRYSSGRYSSYSSTRDPSSSISSSVDKNTTTLSDTVKKEEIATNQNKCETPKPSELERIEKPKESLTKTLNSFLPAASPMTSIPIMTSDSSSTSKSEDTMDSPPKATFMKEKSKTPPLPAPNEKSVQSSPERCLDQLPPQVPKPDVLAINKSASSTNPLNKIAKSTGKKIVKKIKVKPKDGEPKKRQLRKSVSTSSGDSETSLQNGDCEVDNALDNTKKKITGSKLKLRTTLSKLKITNQTKDAQNNINSDSSTQNSESRSHTVSLSRTNSTETNSTPSSNSTSDEDCEDNKTKKSETKTIYNEMKYDGSSRTSVLASSADEVSLSLDKSFKPSPSPKCHVSEPRTEEAKSFLMRALAPVTNLFKMRQESAEKNHCPESVCDSENQNTSNVASITTDVESKSSNKPKTIRHIESGERAWWMESTSDKSNDNKKSSPLSSNALEESKNSNNNGFKFNIVKQDSGERPWWLDSNGNIPEGVEVRTPSRKGSSDSEQSDKYNVYKIRDIDTGEKDWWQTSESAKSAGPDKSPTNGDNSVQNNVCKIRCTGPDSVEKDWWQTNDKIPKSAEPETPPKSAEHSKTDDNFTLNVVRIRHIESGERPWWLASNQNIPEGIEKRSTPSVESDSDSSSDKAEENGNLKAEIITNGTNTVAGIPLLVMQDDEYEEPLGDRRSPEGLETPLECERFSGRTSPYENVVCNRIPNVTAKQKSASKNVPYFISRHMDIDDILGTSGQLFSPMMDRILSRKTGREIVEGDNSECREIDPREVRIHDSTAQRPVIQKLRDRSDIIDCRDEVDGVNLDDSALQVYKDGDYGPYLDLESSLSEQQEELEGFHKNRKNYIVLRTQLSVRVHAIREKLLNSDGRELRRALFSLKQIFQEDKDLVHEFVQNDGLDCLIRVGSDADQYYQNYILRALGQVMLYVDGMNGVMKHNASLQWLYSLIASKFRLVVKTTLKLLLVFVEYVDTNCLLLIKAIEAVDCIQGLPPWSNIMNLLKDYDASDTELLIYAMTLINNCLNGIPDQDTYYDQTDCLEDQGIYNIIQRYMSKQGTDLDLLRQFQIYEAVLSHEDGNDNGTPLRQLDDSIRQKLRHRKLVEDSKQGRKSRRHYSGLTTGVTNGGSCDSAIRYNQALLQSALADEDDDQPLSPQPSKPSDAFRDSKEVAMSLQRRRERVQRQRDFIKEQQKLSSQNKKEEIIETPVSSQGHQIYTSGLQQRIQNGTLGHSGSKDLTLAVNSINKQMDEMDLLESPKGNGGGKADLGQWMKRLNQNGDTSYEEPKIINDDPLNLKKPMLMIDKESTVKDITEKLCSPCAIRNQIEDGGKVNLVENMTGVISKAMKGLAKSKSKSIVRSPTIEISNKGEAKKTESDFSWDSIIASLDRPLRLKDLDFTDLSADNIENISNNSRSDGWVPPPPPLFMSKNMNDKVPPPPPGCIPLPPQFSAPPVPSLHDNSANISPDYHNKSKKTIKLFWREINDVKKISNIDPSSIWDEIIPVKIESKILEHLFESRTKDVIKQLEINKNKEVIVLDHKRSNAINILLKKLPPPQAIKNAIIKMDATVLTREGIDKLIAMLPSEEETLKIQEAQVSNPSIPLGNAEQFLLTLSSISELNARLKLWVFKLDFESIENEIAEPYMDFKLAMEILRKNHTFKKIVSAILSTGNFLNSSDAKGFQLEYLSKIHEVKDTVHKHSLLHHLCHIILDQFPETTDLYSEIGPVTRASKVNFEELSANIERLEIDCKASTNYLKEILKHDGNLMKAKLGDFLHDCAERIIILSIIKKRLYYRYTEFLSWLGIPLHRMIETRPSDIFKVISEFALEYRTTRERVLEQRARKACHRERNKTRGKMIMDVGILLGPETADNQLKSILSSQDPTTLTAFNRKRKDPDPIDKSNKSNHSGGIEEAFNSMLSVKMSPDKKSDHHHKRYTKSQKGSIKRSRTREGIHNELRLDSTL